MARFVSLVLVALAATLCLAGAAAGNEQRTLEQAATALREITDLKIREIPEALLADAHAVAVIPNVVKVGFVAGVQRGKGVVLLREEGGRWSLPRFVTITGGSVGWQIGAQATDFVLVFKTDRSVGNLLKGKFTIGADAAAAAGPVGRRAEAATDAQLQAEIYSYSRSRGLFAGVSLEGSVIQLDQAAEMAFYVPGRPVPDSAIKLTELLTGLTAAVDQGAGAVVPEPTAITPTALREPRLDPRETLRRQLADASVQLAARLDDSWQRHLALPAEVHEGKQPPPADVVAGVLQRYDAIVASPQYRTLAQLPEFRAAHELLRQYAASLAPPNPRLVLPPPPGQ